MLHRIVTAGFQQIVEADDVGFNIHIRMIDGVTDSRLRRKIHHDIKAVGLEEIVHQCLVADGAADEHMLDRTLLRCLLHKAQAVFLQCRIIVVVHVIKADHCATAHLLQQPDHKVCPDESR